MARKVTRLSRAEGFKVYEWVKTLDEYRKQNLSWPEMAASCQKDLSVAVAPSTVKEIFEEVHGVRTNRPLHGMSRFNVIITAVLEADQAFYDKFGESLISDDSRALLKASRAREMPNGHKEGQ